LHALTRLEKSIADSCKINQSENSNRLAESGKVVGDWLATRFIFEAALSLLLFHDAAVTRVDRRGCCGRTTSVVHHRVILDKHTPTARCGLPM